MRRHSANLSGRECLALCVGTQPIPVEESAWLLLARLLIAQPLEGQPRRCCSAVLRAARTRALACLIPAPAPALFSLWRRQGQGRGGAGDLCGAQEPVQHPAEQGACCAALRCAVVCMLCCAVHGASARCVALRIRRAALRWACAAWWLGGLGWAGRWFACSGVQGDDCCACAGVTRELAVALTNWA